MIPALQPNSSGGHTEATLLLPAAALHAAAQPLEHMLECEVAQEEASVWVECVCSHAGAAKVLRACIVTQVNIPHTKLHIVFHIKYCAQFGQDERPLLAAIAAYARTHLMTISDVVAALSRVAYTMQNSTLVAEQLHVVACAAAAEGGLTGWMRLLEWFQESLQVKPLIMCLISTCMTAFSPTQRSCCM